MTVLSILKGARELLADPANWNNRGMYVRRKDDDAMPGHGQEYEQAFQHPEGHCFCVVGAMAAAGKKTPGEFEETAEGEAAVAAFSAAGNLRGKWGVFDFNDKHAKHPDILATFDKAIAELEPA